MRIFITHNNFPAQFRHIAEYLGRTPGHQVVFATQNLRKEWAIPGVKKVLFTQEEATGKTSPFAHNFDEAVRHGAGLLRLCGALKKQGFIPDLVLGHSGWGQTLFIKDAFPDTPFVGYFEWYYNANSAESNFPQREREVGERAHLRLRNSAILHDLAACEAGITPTLWQKDQFPLEFEKKLHQIHDGIDTAYFSPAKNGRLPIESLNLPETDLKGATELVTYCSRGLEPYRGFPQFYEAIPAILEARPNCHVLIVGDDRVCYSPRLPNNGSYKKLMQDTIPLDTDRVHFTGPLPYGKYKQVLQASSAHVYLTWPFVLSWSFLEAMSCGCLIVGSDTEPVREVMQHQSNGLLTDFHSSDKIAESVIFALSNQKELEPIRTNARKTIQNGYSLNKCLPAHLSLLNQIAQKR